MKNKNILISGAGIAGLTLAYCLKKNGFHPTIVEKHPQLRIEGYKIDIRGTAIEVIKRLGLYETIFAKRTQLKESIFVNREGKEISKVHPDFCGTRVQSDLEIDRGDLLAILFQKIAGVECLFGETIQNMKEQGDSVHVTFKKASPRIFDLVIGADGLHSAVRKLTFGSEAQFLHDFGLYIAFFPFPNFLQLYQREIEYHGPSKFAIAYCLEGDVAKAGFAFYTPPDGKNMRDIVVQKTLVKSAFNDAGWEIPGILSHIDRARDFYFDCVGQIRMSHWSDGRTTLVGDAAYAVSPLSGQGASLALIGAYVLANELVENKGDYKKAFPTYEKLLKPFVLKNQKLANMSVKLLKGRGTSWLLTKLIGLSYRLGKLKGWIHFFKARSLKKTTKSANALTLKKYDHRNTKDGSAI